MNIPADTSTNYLHFEGDFKKGHYQINIDPDRYYYEMVFPDNKVAKGSLPALLDTIQNDPSSPDLNMFLKSIILSVMEPNKTAGQMQTKKFFINNHEYRISFSSDGLVNLHFPEMMIVSDRFNLSNHFPEVLSIKKGALSGLISTVIADSGNIPDDENNQPKGLPQYCDQVNYYDIQGWNVALAYRPDTDVIFLNLDARTVRTHISAIALDAWEYSTLHDGEYRIKVDDILSQYLTME